MRLPFAIPAVQRPKATRRMPCKLVGKCAASCVSRLTYPFDASSVNEEHEGTLMHCPRCGFANPEGMNFCGRCGTALSAGCPHCGFENPPGFAFCGKCGSALTSQPPAPASAALAPQSQPPLTYTPHYLAEKI